MRKLKHLLLLASVVALTSSCGIHVDPPVTSHIVYDVQKVFDASCGPNRLCVSFDGSATYNGGGSGGCTPEAFTFDSTSSIVLVVSTQPMFPPTQLSVDMSQIDNNSQPVQNLWHLVLIPNPPGQSQWIFTFTPGTPPNQPSTSPSQSLQSGVAVKGQYILGVPGDTQTIDANIKIHAERTVLGAVSHLCSAN